LQGVVVAEPDFKTQDALNESRILVLGVQVLLSFQYSSFLESTFNSLPRSSQYLEVIALGLLIIAFGLVVAPAPNHLLIWSDEDSPSLQRFVTIATAIALVPFATAMALDVYVTTERVGHSILALILGAATLPAQCSFGTASRQSTFAPGVINFDRRSGIIRCQIKNTNDPASRIKFSTR
jgi:hypothetical protein